MAFTHKTCSRTHFELLDHKTHWMLQFWVTPFFFQTESVNTNLDTTASKQSVQQSPAWRPEQLMMRVTLLATTNLPRNKGLYVWHWLLTVSSLPAPGPGCPISLLAHCSLNHVLETTLTNYIHHLLCALCLPNHPHCEQNPSRETTMGKIHWSMTHDWELNWYWNINASNCWTVLDCRRCPSFVYTSFSSAHHVLILNKFNGPNDSGISEDPTPNLELPVRHRRKASRATRTSSNC